MAEQTILESNTLTNSNNRNNVLRKRIILERCRSFPEQIDTIQHFAEHQRSCLHDIEEVSLCVCQQSKNFPICDNTHELFDLNIQPMVVSIPKRLLHDTFSTKRPLSRSQNIVNTHNELSSCGKNCSNCSDKSLSDGCFTNVETDTSKQQKQDHMITPTSLEWSAPSIMESQSNVAKTFQTSIKLPTNDVDPKSKPQTYSMKEVSQHRTKNDCWIVFYDKVYDVTPYFEFHPGGERALLKFAGKDGTENVEFHSKQMMALLDKYFFIGHLRKEDVTYPPPNQCTII